jgi:hypothetical protein
MSPATTPPIVARFQFKPERAAEFSYSSEFVEMQLDEIEEVIAYCEEFQDALVDCTACVNGRIISLADFK